jgi:hypothetical protein
MNPKETNMKKTLLLISLMLLFVGLANAQNRYGLRAGLNISSLEFTADGESIDTSNSLGIHAGLFMQHKTKQGLILQPELLYSQKGSLSSDRAYIDYIEAPLLFKLSFNLQKTLVQPLAGPQVGYAIRAESDLNPDLLGDINRLNLGINLGVDLVYSDDYFGGLRYYLGLSNLEKDTAKREPISDACWMLSAGYLF